MVAYSTSVMYFNIFTRGNHGIGLSNRIGFCLKVPITVSRHLAAQFRSEPSAAMFFDQSLTPITNAGARKSIARYDSFP